MFASNRARGLVTSACDVQASAQMMRRASSADTGAPVGMPWEAAPSQRAPRMAKTATYATAGQHPRPRHVSRGLWLQGALVVTRPPVQLDPRPRARDAREACE